MRGAGGRGGVEVGGYKNRICKMGVQLEAYSCIATPVFAVS